MVLQVIPLTNCAAGAAAADDLESGVMSSYAGPTRSPMQLDLTPGRALFNL
jgi:hypothetical protein